MTHYICRGECGGISDHPKKCEDEKCSLYGKDLVECNCTDNRHRDKKEEE